MNKIKSDQVPTSIDKTDLAMLQKNAKLKSGEALVNAAAKHAVEEREKILKEHQDEKVDKDSTSEAKEDCAQLSEKSKWFGIYSKTLEENIKWTLEMEKAWLLLLNWIPTGTSIATQINELTDLYLSLMEAILTHTSDVTEQNEQIQMLEQVLSKKLNLLFEKNVGALDAFLDKYGQKQTVIEMKSEIFRHITGNGVGAQEAERMFTHNSPGTAAAYGKSSDQGMLYQMSKNGGVAFSRQYNTHAEQEKLHTNQYLQAMRKQHAQLGQSHQTIYSEMGTGKYSMADLQKTNSFLTYIERDGNLFQNPNLSIHNDEALGVLSAIMSMKSALFIKESHLGRSASIAVHSGVDKMIDSYVHQRFMTQGRNTRDTFRIHNYILSIYSNTKDAQKAISKGLEYAYQIFSNKKETTTNVQDIRNYQMYAFWGTGKKDINADLKEGNRILQKDWQQFLQNLERYAGSIRQMEKQSPWGMLVKPFTLKKPVAFLLTMVFLALLFIWGILQFFS